MSTTEVERVTQPTDTRAQESSADATPAATSSHAPARNPVISNEPLPVSTNRDSRSADSQTGKPLGRGKVGDQTSASGTMIGPAPTSIGGPTSMGGGEIGSVGITPKPAGGRPSNGRSSARSANRLETHPRRLRVLGSCGWSGSRSNMIQILMPSTTVD